MKMIGSNLDSREPVAACRGKLAQERNKSKARQSKGAS
jgi:hypothetical protein